MQPTRLHPRDRRALAATAGQFFVNGAMTATFLARAPQIRDRIDVTVEQFGLLLTGAALFGIIGSLLASRIIHTTSTRGVLRVGAAVMVISLVLMGAARDPILWMVGMVVYVFFNVLVDISMNLQGSWISARRHAPVMNRLHGAWSVGAFAGGLAAVAANSAGWSTATHFLGVAVVMSVCLVLISRSLLPDDEDEHANAIDRTPPGERFVRRTRAPLVLLVFAGMFAVVAEVTGGDWAAFRLTDDFAADASLGSLAFALYMAGMTSMRFGGDWLQSRLGRAGLHRFSICLATFGFVLASLVPNQNTAIAGFLLVGAGVATFMPMLYDDAARFPGRRGAGLGAMTAGMSLAFVVSPGVTGWLVGTGLTVGEAIAVLGLPALAGLAIVTELNQRLLR